MALFAVPEIKLGRFKTISPMSKHYPPAHGESKFHCVHCGVYAAQIWRQLYFHASNGGMNIHQDLDYCVCSHCNAWSYWFNESMIIPSEAPVPPAHIDMPDACLLDYAEAREVLARSPRAAAALVRLSLQKLMVALGEKGKNINEDIASLVSKGLPSEIQQALDYCRVVGNNAVHPGEIDLNDTPETAYHMFTMMNFIVEDRVSRPKKIAALYSALPDGAKKAIETRDGKAT